MDRDLSILMNLGNQKYGNNYIVTGEGYQNWLEVNRVRNSEVLLHPTKDEQYDVYKKNKDNKGFVLYLIEPKELLPVWYSYTGIQTVILTENEDTYWNAYPDYWFINHTLDDTIVTNADGSRKEV